MNKFLRNAFFVLLITLFFTSCGEQDEKRIVIWTNCSEFAQYVELFNNTHPDKNAIVVYKQNPAEHLPPAQDEAVPDLIVSSWLRNDETTKYFKPVNYLFDRKNLSSEIFYPQLLQSGKIKNKQFLLPVSFNLPAIIFSTENKDLVSENYTLTLEQIRTIASQFNQKNKKGAFTKIGFTPLTNDDFLYLATKLYNVDFREERGQIIWNHANLQDSLKFLKDWTFTENASPKIEEDFAYKYLFMQDYRLIDSDRTLFAHITSDRLFSILKNQDLQIDYRWICNENSIPMEDSFTMMGIYKKCKNQVGATEFITWFFDIESQTKMVSRKSQLNLNTELFGIAGGFSSVKQVTELILPRYYTPLLQNLPVAQMIEVPQNLPPRWESYKSVVIQPYIKESIKNEEYNLSINDLEKEWLKKVFD